MVNGYYEYRLHELTNLISICEGRISDEEILELKKERKQILHELRHTESLPRTYEE